MIKTHKPASSAFPLAGGLRVALACAILSGCGQESDISIEPIVAESALPLFEGGQADAHQSPERLMLNFDSSPFHSSGTYSFFRLSDHVVYSIDQGYRSVGSMQVSNRTASWQGPLLTLPPLQNRSYTASMWVRLINTQRTAKAKLVLMQITDGDNISVPIVEVEVTPGAWQNIEGRIAGVQSEDKLHVLRLEVEGADVDYLVDDILVEESKSASGQQSEVPLISLAQSTPPAGLIINGDLENGLQPWTYQGGKISLSKRQAHSGEYSLLVSARTAVWHAPVMILKDLEDHRPYRVSIFVRLTEDFPSAEVKLTLKQEVDGKPSFITIASTRAYDNGWTEVAGNIQAPNFSSSEHVSIYLESANPIASYYVDSLTITPQ